MSKELTAIHKRTLIRKYIIALLKKHVDIGGRVYGNRPDPVFLDELPVCLVHFDNEPAEVLVGDRYSPTTYQRNAILNVDFMVDQTAEPKIHPDQEDEAETLLDFFSYQTEVALFEDETLARELPGYDPDDVKTHTGLTLGMRLISTNPYNVDTESERRIVGQRLQVEIPYETNAYANKRLKTFKSFKADIVRIGSTETTIDRALIIGEGSLS